MLGLIGSLFSAGGFSVLKWAGIALAAAALAWLAYEFAWRGGEIDRLDAERIRLEGEVAEAVAANESLERARKHEMMRHERELSALKAVTAVQVDVAQGMAALNERLALLAADACEVSQGLQQEIDDANKRRMQDAP